MVSIRTDKKVLVNHKTGGIPAVGADDELVDDAAFVGCDGIVSRDADKGDKRGLLELKPVLFKGPVSDAVGIVPLVKAEAALIDLVCLAERDAHEEHGEECCLHRTRWRDDGKCPRGRGGRFGQFLFPLAWRLALGVCVWWWRLCLWKAREQRETRAATRSARGQVGAQL